MNIQYISDIHLERGKGKEIKSRLPVLAPILVLAGDIGNPSSHVYRTFIQHCSEDFDHVSLITGNHEYYTDKETVTITGIDELIQQYCSQFKNVHFLQNNSVVINDIIFYGCTMWSYIPYVHEAMVSFAMNDYTKIYTEVGQKLTVDTQNDIHLRMVEKLVSFLDNHMKDKVVVITHHCPLLTDDTVYVKRKLSNNKSHDNLDFAYCNEFDDIFDEYNNLIVWIYGHTHRPCNIKRNQCRIVSNPHGYPSEHLYNPAISYYPQAIIQLQNSSDNDPDLLN